MFTVRRVLIAVACVGLPLGGLAVGCGGSSEVKDAGGMDSTAMMETGTADTGPDVKDAGCVPDADLFKLNFGDAGWPGDSGIDGGSPQICWDCLKTKCQMLVSQCNTNCACNSAVFDTLTCAQMNGFSINCGGPLLNYDPNFGIQFLTCAAGQCNGPCPIPQQGDGGGGDAAKDAPGGG